MHLTCAVLQTRHQLMLLITDCITLFNCTLIKSPISCSRILPRSYQWPERQTGIFSPGINLTLFRHCDSADFPSGLCNFSSICRCAESQLVQIAPWPALLKLLDALVGGPADFSMPCWSSCCFTSSLAISGIESRMPAYDVTTTSGSPPVTHIYINMERTLLLFSAFLLTVLPGPSHIGLN